MNNNNTINNLKYNLLKKFDKTKDEIPKISDKTKEIIYKIKKERKNNVEKDTNLNKHLDSSFSSMK